MNAPQKYLILSNTLFIFGILTSTCSILWEFQQKNQLILNAWLSNKKELEAGLSTEWQGQITKALGKNALHPEILLRWNRDNELVSPIFPEETKDPLWKKFLEMPAIEQSNFLEAQLGKKSWDRVLALRQKQQLNPEKFIYSEKDLTLFERSFFEPEILHALQTIFSAASQGFADIPPEGSWTFARQVFFMQNALGETSIAYPNKNELAPLLKQFAHDKNIQIAPSDAFELQVSVYQNQEHPYKNLWLLVVGICLVLLGLIPLFLHFRKKNLENFKRLLFFDLIVHELKTPLTAANMYQQLLSMSPALNKDTDLKNYSDTIGKNLLYLENMIDEYSFLNRRGKPRMGVFEKEDLDTLLKDLSNKFTQKFHIQDKTPTDVFVDPKYLKVVLNNVMKNATLYGKKAEVFFQTKDDRLLLSIQDEGPGVSRWESWRIFSQFYRGKSGIERGSGMGLGLYLSRSMLKECNGKIFVANPGKPHAEFVISLKVSA